MILDPAAGELTLKLVYWGPPGSGKTTNLRILHERCAAPARGPLMAVGSPSGRTVFFDLLTIFLRASGALVRLRVHGLPGGAEHAPTRRMVLRGADGVAFVADGRRSQAGANDEAWAELQAALGETGLYPSGMPAVVQANKLDLEGAWGREELRRIGSIVPHPVLSASAGRGEGVVETFLALAGNVLARGAVDPALRQVVPDPAGLMLDLRARLAPPGEAVETPTLS